MPPEAGPPFIVMIPARLASTRLPDKALADLEGKPMVVHVAARARESGAARVIVATDSARIAAVCAHHGIEAVMTRESHRSGTDRIAEACDLLGVADDTIVVNVQGDEPLIAPQLIAQCAGALASSADCAIATAAHAFTDVDSLFDPNIVKVVTDATGRALLFSRAPIPYARDAFRDGRRPEQIDARRHIGLYAYRRGFLRQFPQLPMAPIEQSEALEQLRALWHGFRIMVFEADAAPHGGVDTPADLERVRAHLAAVGAAPH